MPESDEIGTIESGPSLHVVHGESANPSAAQALVDALRQLQVPGTLYLGYPVLSTSDDRLFVDALLVNQTLGVVAFHFTKTALHDHGSLDRLQAELDDTYVALTQRLRQYRSLRKGRELAFQPAVVAVSPEPVEAPKGFEGEIVTADTLGPCLEQISGFDAVYFRPLVAALQRVSVLRPAKKRLSVLSDRSRGGVLKRIEQETNNLDHWQNLAAIETPEGQQCIRGLAGTGKTVVLALKAAFLHARHPDWSIAVTFYTRSLYQQFTDLVRRFSYDQLGDEPDWSHLRILHAWGSQAEPGIYAEIAAAGGSLPKSFTEARQAFGLRHVFEGVCDDLMKQLEGKQVNAPFDVILVDEAQDFPRSFFQLVYGWGLKQPRRIVWAYDELQNLGDYMLASPMEMFGVELVNEDGKPKQDIVLPVCYRNTPWALTVAHAVGFGVYRTQGLVQMVDDPSRDVWTRLGYEVVGGRSVEGQQVSLRRARDSAPTYFEDLVDPDDGVQPHVFESAEDQAEWVSQEIHKNLHNDELELDDILVIFPDPLTVSQDSKFLRDRLKARGIASHIAGVTTSRDVLFSEASIAVTGIFRAKGNEAPMVYILNSEYAAEGPELIKRRNTLFTGITRSRAWVRVCGCGERMQRLADEIRRVKAEDYRLRFTIPGPGERDRMRRVYREISGDDQKQLKALEQIAEKMLAGDLPLEMIPEDTMEKLRRILRSEG